MPAAPVVVPTTRAPATKAFRMLDELRGICLQFPFGLAPGIPRGVQPKVAVELQKTLGTNWEGARNLELYAPLSADRERRRLGVNDGLQVGPEEWAYGDRGDPEYQPRHDGVHGNVF